MILTDQQKDDLKALTEHRGFKILEEIAEEKRQNLFSSFENMAINDPQVLQNITGAQNLNKGMRILIDTAKGLSQKVSKKEHK